MDSDGEISNSKLFIGMEKMQMQKFIKCLMKEL